MAVNIYDTANQIESELRETKEFKALDAAFTEMQKDPKAYDLFKQFQNIQISLSQKQMNGDELSDDEVKKAHQLADQVGDVPVIKTLMDRERALNQLMNDLNQIITKPIQELYRN